MVIVLAIFSGLGLGFFLGQQYILYKQRKGYILPVNPFALPKVEQPVSCLDKDGITIKYINKPQVIDDPKSNLRDENLK